MLSIYICVLYKKTNLKSYKIKFTLIAQNTKTMADENKLKSPFKIDVPTSHRFH